MRKKDDVNVRLGGVVVSKPTAAFGRVVQYDLGKHSNGGGFERTGTLDKPPLLLRTSVESLAADHSIRVLKCCNIWPACCKDNLQWKKSTLTRVLNMISCSTPTNLFEVCRGARDFCCRL